MSRVSRLGADAAEAIRAAKPNAEGWRSATIWIESPQHAAGLLLGFDNAVEVLQTGGWGTSWVNGFRELLGLPDLSGSALTNAATLNGTMVDSV